MSEFIITHDVERDADAVIRRFHGDPAEWLPRPVTEHGAHEFRSLVTAWWRTKLTFAVGDVWKRGNSYTRRFVMSTPRDEGLATFGSVVGELSLLNRFGNITLRYNARTHPRHGRFTRLLPYTAQAHSAAREVLEQIAAHLAEPAHSELPRP